MKTYEFDDQLRRLATLSTCSEQELQELLTLFENHSSFRDQALDDRLLDTLLSFQSESADQHETFVSNCLSRIQTPAAETGTSSDEIRLDIERVLEVKTGPTVHAISQPASRSWAMPQATLTLSVSLAIVLLLLLGTGIWVLPSQSPTGLPQVEAPPSGMERPNLAESTPAESQRVDPVVEENRDSVSSQVVIHPGEAQPPTVDPEPNRSDPPPMNVAEYQPDSDPVPAVQANEQILAVEKRVTPTFAEWIPVRTLASDPMPAQRRVGQGPFTTDQPTSRLLMDNGVALFLQGPFSGQLVDANSLLVNSGSVYLETEAENETFRLSTPDTEWQATGNVGLQLNVDSAGQQECFVFKGHVDLQRPDQPGTDSAIALTPKGLNQVLIEPGNQQGIPTILAARGRKQFLGQVGFPEQKGKQSGQPSLPIWQTDSPEYFTRFVNRLAQRKTPVRGESFPEQWLKFVERTREMDTQRNDTNQRFEQMMEQFFENGIPGEAGQKRRDDLLPGTTQFQGSININGKEQKFDTIEDFHRARQAGNLQNPLQPGATPNAAQAFQGEINLNGRSFKFSTPQQFNSMRRRARR